MAVSRCRKQTVFVIIIQKISAVYSNFYLIFKAQQLQPADLLPFTESKA